MNNELVSLLFKTNAFKICEENSIFFNIYTEKLTISKSLNYNILFYNNENKNVPEDKKTNIKIIDNIYRKILKNKFAFMPNLISKKIIAIPIPCKINNII